MNRFALALIKIREIERSETTNPKSAIQNPKSTRSYLKNWILVQDQGGRDI